MATNWTFAAQINIPGIGWNVFDPDDVMGNVPVKVKRGVTEAGEIMPSQATFRIRDDEDQWRPSNAAGPHYELLTQYMRGAFATTSSVRMTGEVASFKPDETLDHRADVNGVTDRGVRWVDFTVEDALRRVGQWDDPLESAMRHQIGGYDDLRGYWPLEDSAGSTRTLNAADSGRQGWIGSGVTLAGADGPAGSDKVLQLGTGGTFGGAFTTMTVDNTGWQIFIHVKTGTPTDATHLPLISWTASDGTTWSFGQSNSGYRTTVVNRENVTLYTQATTYGTGAEPGQWVTYRIKVTRSGSTVTVETGWNPESDVGLLYGYTGTYSGPAMRPVSWRVYQHANNDGAAYGHIGCFYSNVVDIQDLEFRRAFQGYRGEYARSRFIRLMQQHGLSYVARGTSNLTAIMGPQKQGTLMDNLREIVATDDALIYGRRDNNGIVFRPWHDMVNQTPALALTWPDDQLGGLKEITDDLGLFNDITVKNASGGEATAVLLTGPGSVASIGRVRKTVDVNIDQTQVVLDLVAGYYLNKFTVTSPRFTSIVLDLDANESLVTAFNALEIGDTITVDGRTPDQLALRVLQISESVSRKRRTAELVVEPADIWINAGLYDDARADARGHVLTGGPYAAGDTVLSVDVDAGDGLAWTHDDGDYGVRISGEVVTVTAVAAPVAGVQDLTVTRAVNGVAKTLNDGARVELAVPYRYWKR